MPSSFSTKDEFDTWFTEHFDAMQPLDAATAASDHIESKAGGALLLEESMPTSFSTKEEFDTWFTEHFDASQPLDGASAAAAHIEGKQGGALLLEEDSVPSSFSSR